MKNQYSLFQKDGETRSLTLKVAQERYEKEQMEKSKNNWLLKEHNYVYRVSQKHQSFLAKKTSIMEQRSASVTVLNRNQNSSEVTLLNNNDSTEAYTNAVSRR